jgi:uncharacterized protein (DUF4415 family)
MRWPSGRGLDPAFINFGRRAPTKFPVGIRLDDDVLAWFKASGPGYQTRINTVLRRHVEAQRKAR